MSKKTKLKTLDDIIDTNYCTVCATMLRRELREEGIKRYKKLREDNRYNASMEVAEFFNITDEDLK